MIDYEQIIVKTTHKLSKQELSELIAKYLLLGFDLTKKYKSLTKFEFTKFY